MDQWTLEWFSYTANDSTCPPLALTFNISPKLIQLLATKFVGFCWFWLGWLVVFWVFLKGGWHNSRGWSHFKIKWGHFTLYNTSTISRHRVDINKNNPNQLVFYLKYFSSIVFLYVTIKSYQHFCWSPAFSRHIPFSGTVGYTIFSCSWLRARNCQACWPGMIGKALD